MALCLLFKNPFLYLVQSNFNLINILNHTRLWLAFAKCHRIKLIPQTIKCMPYVYSLLYKLKLKHATTQLATLHHHARPLAFAPV